MNNSVGRLIGLFAMLAVFTARPLHAQQVSGRVTSSSDGKPVAFAHITDTTGRLIAVCDLDGRFSAGSGHRKLTVSSVGFSRKTVSVDVRNLPLEIKLEPSTEELAEVVVAAGENPAHRIIRNARNNLKSNSPLSLGAYQLERYDRLVIGADSGSRLPNPALEQHLRSYDLLIMEALVRERYTGSGGKTTEVLANRVSGLKDPVFVFLMDQLHSTDFYGDNISIGGSDYVSPLAEGSLSRYRLVLEDVVRVNETDSLFTISFEPRPESRFEGLKGRISIQSPDWAIRSVVASPANSSGNITAEIRQLYEKAPEGAWFPVLLNTRLWLKLPTSSGLAILTGEGFSKIQQIGPVSGKSDKTPYTADVVFSKEALTADENRWREMRPDSLSRRLLETYRFMDSLGQAQKLDRLLSFSGALARGYLRLGSIDVVLGSLLRFNNIEGYRPGMEVRTNHFFSPRLSLGLYAAYATRISKPLWGTDARLSSGKQPRLWLDLSVYDKHVARESGLADEQKGVLNPFTFRQLFYSSINYLKGYKISANLPLHRNLSVIPGYSQEKIGALNQQYEQPGSLQNPSEAKVSSLSFLLRLAPGERFMFSGQGLQNLSSPNPLILTEFKRMYIRSPGKDLMVANQLRISVDYVKNFLYAGQSLVRFESGLTDRDIPEILQFQMPGSYNKYFLFAPYSFATVEPGTCQTPGFASLYHMHHLPPLRAASKRFRPRPAIINHLYIRILPWNFNRAQANVFTTTVAESGLIFTHLISSGAGNLGAGFMYRWTNLPNMGEGRRFILKLAFSPNKPAN